MESEKLLTQAFFPGHSKEHNTNYLTHRRLPGTNKSGAGLFVVAVFVPAGHRLGHENVHSGKAKWHPVDYGTNWTTLTLRMTWPLFPTPSSRYRKHCGRKLHSPWPQHPQREEHGPEGQHHQHITHRAVRGTARGGGRLHIPLQHR